MGIKKKMTGGEGHVSYTLLVFYMIAFVLYTLCFKAIFTPNLEIVGFGLYIALHILLMGGMLYKLFASDMPKSNAPKLCPTDFFKIIEKVPFFKLISALFSWEKVCSLMNIAYKSNGNSSINMGWVVTVLSSILVYIYSFSLAAMTNQHDFTQCVKVIEFYGLIALFLTFFLTFTIKWTVINNSDSILYTFIDVIKLSFAIAIIPAILILFLAGLIAWVVWMIFYSPFIIYNYISEINATYQENIPYVIAIGLCLLFVSLIMFMMTLIKLHAVHKTMNNDPVPEYIPGNYIGIKYGYDFKESGDLGQGYYVNKNELTTYFMNDDYSTKLKDEFKIVGITTTVALVAEFLGYSHYDNIFGVLKIMIQTIRKTVTPYISTSSQLREQKPNVQTEKRDGCASPDNIDDYYPAALMDMFSVVLRYGIIALSSYTVWETQKIGSRMGAISDPPGSISPLPPPPPPVSASTIVN